MAALWGVAFLLSLWAAAPATLVVADNVRVESSGSILEALLESHYSEWMELVELATMLQPLEELVASGEKLTIFAPQNHQLSAEIKSFLLRPSNAVTLKRVVQHHVLSERVTAAEWRAATFSTLGSDSISLRVQDNVLYAGDVTVATPDSLVREDGVVHGVEEILLPNSVMKEFVAYSTSKTNTPLPTGAPGLDNRRAQLLEQQYSKLEAKLPTLYNNITVSPPPLAPSLAAPVLAPSIAPAPGPSATFYLGIGEDEVTTFIQALLQFGGYTEFAGLLVDLTSLGQQISKLVNMGYRLTILAPDDKAWFNALTDEQISSQTALEDILHYHIITEYQTEESLYSTLRRTGKSSFATLKVPHKLVAREVDGMVVFGEGHNGAGVYDPYIFGDDRLSVLGIDKVLVPSDEKTEDPEEQTESPPSPKRTDRHLIESETETEVESEIQTLKLPTESSTPNAGPERIIGVSTKISAFAAFVVAAVNIVLF
ncbi:hypothetical protein R1sor_004321 [Riccia sorocarpa]|uniref:FAS1 domain-containing protein n=1 Tax=Riccia sorocarpa TaxID=122646 RepID=A0ABD3HK49_9MARC